MNSGDRMTYIPSEVALEFNDFIIERDVSNENELFVRARVKDFSVLTIIKLLYSLRGGEVSFSNLYTRSRIRMKRAFLNYLDFSLNYEFIRKKVSRNNTMYSLTEKGLTLLRMFLKNDFKE